MQKKIGKKMKLTKTKIERITKSKICFKIGLEKTTKNLK